MVDVSHYSDDGGSFHEVFRFVHLFLDLFFGISRYKFDFISKLFRYQYQCFCVKTLIDGDHKAQIHASCYDFGDRGIVHHYSQVVDCNELCNLELIALHLLKFSLFLHSLGDEFPLFPSVL